MDDIRIGKMLDDDDAYLKVDDARYCHILLDIDEYHWISLDIS